MVPRIHTACSEPPYGVVPMCSSCLSRKNSFPVMTHGIVCDAKIFHQCQRAETLMNLDSFAPGAEFE